MYPDYLIVIDFIVLVMSGWIKFIKFLIMLFKHPPLHWGELVPVDFSFT